MSADAPVSRMDGADGLGVWVLDLAVPGIPGRTRNASREVAGVLCHRFDQVSQG